MHAKPAQHTECLAVTALLCSVSCATLGESEPAAGAKDTVLEEVIVLGSHIPRLDYSSMSPVYTISREDLEADKLETVAEQLNRYPQFVADRNANTTDFSARTGAAAVNLRGLGANRNLVLINGRRLGPSGADAVVDVNQLPVGLVERVEILTGGASTAYGSDAVSGVVNFSLRNDVDGVELSTGYGRSDREDGDTSDFSLLGGTAIAQGRGNLTGFIGYLDRDGVVRSDRPFATHPIDFDPNTGDLFVGGAVSVPGGYSPGFALIDGELTSKGLTFDRDGNPKTFTDEDRYNYNQVQELQYRLERLSGGAFLDFELTHSVQAKMGLIISRNKADPVLAPATLVFEDLLVNLDNPLLSAQTQEVLGDNYDPGNTGFASLLYAYRPVQAGNRKRQFKRDYSWIDTEISGRWGEIWRWTAAYTRSDADMKLKEIGGASNARIQQAVLVNPATGECFDPSGGCSPADVFGIERLSPQAVAFIRENPYVTREDTTQQVVSFGATGKLALTQNFQPALALGLEWRQDKTRYRPDPDLLNTRAFEDSYPVSGNDEVSEAYGEILLPLAQGLRWVELLELELGLRYSDYSKVGGEWTWKGGLSWVPAQSVRLRGSYQRAARAPNREESYLPLTENTHIQLGGEVSDPCAASRRPQDFPGYTDLCIEQGTAPANLPSYEPSESFLITETRSGNTDLDVEKVDTYTLGAVWMPDLLPGFSLTLDYYRIEIEDPIGYLDPWEAFDFCFLGRNDGSLCNGVERVPGGDLSQITGSYYNLGKIMTSGYDLGMRVQLPHTAPWGWDSAFEIAVIASKLDSFKVVLGSGEGYDCAGKFGFPCNVGHSGVLPEYRALSRFTYRSGPLSTNISWRYLGSADNAYGIYIIPTGQPYVDAVPRVESQSYLDFSLSWQWGDSLTTSFSVDNLTDNMPPLIANNQENTDSATYDIMGRYYYVGLKIRF